MDSMGPAARFAFGAGAWAPIGKVPSTLFPRGIDDIMRRRCPFSENDEPIYKTHILILVPNKINGRPMSLNTLEECLAHSHDPHNIKYTYYEDRVKEAHGDTPVKKTYWALVSKQLIHKSENTSYEEQSEIIREYSQRAQIPYEAPLAIELAIGIIAECLKNGKKLYPEAVSSFSRSQETVAGKTRQVAVGCFNPGDVFISSSFHLEGPRAGPSRQYVEGEEDDADGIGAVCRSWDRFSLS